MQDSSIPEDDLAMLEALMKSPVYGALKRLLETYRKEVISTLSTSSDTHVIFQSQGRLIGMSIVENLPSLVVQQWRARKEIQEKAAKTKEELEKRLKPRPAPTKGG